MIRILLALITLISSILPSLSFSKCIYTRSNTVHQHGCLFLKSDENDVSFDPLGIDNGGIQKKPTNQKKKVTATKQVKDSIEDVDVSSSAAVTDDDDDDDDDSTSTSSYNSNNNNNNNNNNNDNNNKNKNKNNKVKSKACDDRDAQKKAEYLITNCEAIIIRTLPLEVFRSYQNFLKQYIPRISLIALIVHIMFLIPTFKYIKTTLVGVSIIPFIYLGPIVFILPFLGLWLWENNQVKVPFLDERLDYYVKAVQKQSTRILASEDSKEEFDRIVKYSGDLKDLDDFVARMQVNSIENDDEMETLAPLLYKLSYFRLFSRIDVDGLSSQVQSLKCTGYVQGGSGTSSSINKEAAGGGGGGVGIGGVGFGGGGGGGGAGAITSIEDMDALLRQRNNALGITSPNKDEPQGASAWTAVTQLLKKVEKEGDTTETTLEKLENFQKDLEKL